MGYCFPYSMLCLARLEQRMRPLFFFCFLLPLQYSGLVCHILRLDHDSHQPHNTNLKEQQVRLFLFPSFVHKVHKVQKKYSRKGKLNEKKCMHAN